ncbi:alpha/beta-hydrolase, partial [Aureobasidium pullulans]
LYLDVVRPAGYDNQSLPVLVWIYGGAFISGGTSDRRYNMSYIVKNSVDIGKPIIGISISYRVGPWGFLNSNELMGIGQTNIGLRDQRLALHWIQENIAAFGGDRSKVTIWGQSAGSESVGFHLTAYNGRDDKLFRAAVMQSGSPVAHNPLNGTDAYQPRYDAIVKAVGCENTTNSLDCLRKVPFKKLDAIFNTTEFESDWVPTLDGDFNARFGSEQLKDGSFVHVPVIAGTTSDEGTFFSPTGVETTANFVSYLNTTSLYQIAIPKQLIEDILEEYPANSTTIESPSSQVLGGNVVFKSTYGAQYRRVAAYFGDQVFIASRRLTCQTWSKENVTAYCYRFNTITAGTAWEMGVTHYTDVAYFFNNLEGRGFAVNPFQDMPEEYISLSYLMSNSLVSFTHDLNPNNWTGLGRNDTQTLEWPVYDSKNPMNMVWDANVSSYAESDTWRAKPIELINQNAFAYQR